MGIFDKFKANAVTSMIESFLPNLADLAPQALESITNMLKDEETAQGAKIYAIAQVKETGALNFSLFKTNEAGGIDQYKVIDLSDTKKFIDLILNLKENDTTNPPAIAAPGIANKPTDTTADTGAGI